MNVVVVKFYGKAIGQYDFFTDLELKKGDLVVVDTKNGYVLARVLRYKESSKLAKKWVVDRVNTKAHNERRFKDNERVTSIHTSSSLGESNPIQGTT
jgi:hypothetical protein